MENHLCVLRHWHLQSSWAPHSPEYKLVSFSLFNSIMKKHQLRTYLSFYLQDSQMIHTSMLELYTAEILFTQGCLR